MRQKQQQQEQELLSPPARALLRQQHPQRLQQQSPAQAAPEAAGVYVDAITARHIAGHPRLLLERRCMQHTRERGWM